MLFGVVGNGLCRVSGLAYGICYLPKYPSLQTVFDCLLSDLCRLSMPSTIGYAANWNTATAWLIALPVRAMANANFHLMSIFGQWHPSAAPARSNDARLGPVPGIIAGSPECAATLSCQGAGT